MHRQLFCWEICRGLSTHHSPQVPNKGAAHHLYLSFHVPLTGRWEKAGRLARENQFFQFLSGGDAESRGGEGVRAGFLPEVRGKIWAQVKTLCASVVQHRHNNMPFFFLHFPSSQHLFWSPASTHPHRVPFNYTQIGSSASLSANVIMALQLLLIINRRPNVHHLWLWPNMCSSLHRG